MGIEPTRSLFPDPSLVLKTRPGTSRGHAPGIDAARETMQTLEAQSRDFKTLTPNRTRNTRKPPPCHRNHAVSMR
jgi:hypothetical protein